MAKFSQKHFFRFFTFIKPLRRRVIFSTFSFNPEKGKKVNNLIDIKGIKVLKTDQIKSVSKRIIEANRELQKKENDLVAIKLAEGNVDELLAKDSFEGLKEKLNEYVFPFSDEKNRYPRHIGSGIN